MEESLEVHFCDLCNASVPAAHLGSGEAVRLRGRVIGACCLGELRRAPAASTLAVSNRPASQAMGAVGLAVLLLAVAGAAVFLDWRVTAEADRSAQRDLLLEQRLAIQQGSVDRVADVAGAAASASDLAAASRQIDQLAKAIAASEHRMMGTLESTTAHAAALARGVDRLADEQREHLGRFDRLQREMSSLGSEVAALAERPAAAVPVEGVARPPAAPGDGAAAAPAMPQELAQLVAQLDDEDPGTRFEAVDKLIQSRNPVVVEPLARMVGDADPFVRRLTVEGLAEFRAAASVDALVLALADAEGIVRQAAYASLRTLTGQTIAFDPDGRAEDRRSGQRRWEEWWSKNRDVF
jgi:hypothetical protein